MPWSTRCSRPAHKEGTHTQISAFERPAPSSDNPPSLQLSPGVPLAFRQRLQTLSYMYFHTTATDLYQQIECVPV